MKTSWLVAIAACFVVAIGLAAFVTGCTPANTAGNAFKAQLTDCVFKSATRAEEMACRNQVEARWAVADSGSDAKDITITSVDAGAE